MHFSKDCHSCPYHGFNLTHQLSPPEQSQCNVSSYVRHIPRPLRSHVFLMVVNITCVNYGSFVSYLLNMFLQSSNLMKFHSVLEQDEKVTPIRTVITLTSLFSRCLTIKVNRTESRYHLSCVRMRFYFKKLFCYQFWLHQLHIFYIVAHLIFKVMHYNISISSSRTFIIAKRTSQITNC